MEYFTIHNARQNTFKKDSGESIEYTTLTLLPEDERSPFKLTLPKDAYAGDRADLSKHRVGIVFTVSVSLDGHVKPRIKELEVVD